MYATRARRETKNLPKNEISAATRINLESCPSNKTCYSIPTKTRKKIEIFRDPMIEHLYLDLTEETKIYGKLFQACHAVVKELYRADRGGGTLLTYFIALSHWSCT